MAEKSVEVTGDWPMINARDLLGRQTLASPDQRPFGYVADVMLDLQLRQAVAVVVQSIRPADADRAVSLPAAAAARWVCELSALPPNGGQLVVDESRLTPLETYESKHPALRRFARLAAELPIVDEAGDQQAALWDIGIGDDLGFESIVYRIPRPTTGAHRDIAIDIAQIASIDDRGIVARV